MMRSILLVLFVLYAPFVMAADRLCPDIEELRKATPDTMAGVQADIDRMKLCVERAKLLEQLDNIALKRQEILNKITKVDNALMPIPALPVSSLPPLRAVPSERRAAAPVVAAPSWKVRKIWGQGGDMRAQLADNQGGLLNVAKGDVLPDGAVVEVLSVRGVTVSQNGKTNDVEWEQQAAAPVTPNNMPGR